MKITSILLIIILLIFSACNLDKKSDSYSVEYIYFTKQTTFDKNDAQNAKLFIKNFIGAYREFIYLNVNESFSDSFELGPNYNIEPQVILSTIRGSAVTFKTIDDKTNENNIIVLYTDLPAQLQLFIGPDSSLAVYDSSGNRMSDVQVDSLYSDIPCGYSQPGGQKFVALANNIYSSKQQFPKFFEVGHSTVVAINNLKVFCDGSFDNSAKQEIEDFTIYNSEKDFCWILEKSAYYGKFVAQDEFKSLFNRSEIFRMALADPVLQPKATAIKERIAKSDQNADAYPYWEYIRDVEELRTLAIENALPKAYAEELLKWTPITCGTLFLPYNSFTGFMLQWIIANIIFLTGALLLIRLYKKAPNKITTIFLVGIYSLAISINYWIFSNKPQAMQIQYYILPGIIFVSIWILLYPFIHPSKVAK